MERSPLKILLLSPWLPWPPFGGALIRILRMLSHLAQKHTVTLVTLIRDPQQAQHLSVFDRICTRVVTTGLSDEIQPVLNRLAVGLLHGRPLIEAMHYSRPLANEISRLTAHEQYDIIQVEFSFMAQYLAFVSPQSPAKHVLTMHNIESLRFSRELQFARGTRRLALLVDHLLFRSWEERAVSRFDGVLAVSAPEEAWIRRQAPDAVVGLAPNGVDSDYFAFAEPRAAASTLVFTALMNFPPNIDAAAWFSDEVLPLVHAQHPEICFTIVGDKPDRTVRALGQRRGVRVTGPVPDVRPYLSDALALVVPLRSGGGTRLKILEAMAMGRPVISTSLGAEGLDVTDGLDILLADTPPEFAERVVRLRADPDLAMRLGRAGRRLVEAKYDWATCLKNLGTLYQQVLDAPAASRRRDRRASRARERGE